MSSPNRRPPIPSRNVSESKLLAAPSNFKRSIDLPPDPENMRVNSSEFDFDDDGDEDVEMQRYLEQMYMISGRSPTPENDNRSRQRHRRLPPVDTVQDLGLGGLGLIETGNQTQSPQKLKHKLKGTEEGSHKHRKQGHSQPAPRGSSGTSSSSAKPQHLRGVGKERAIEEVDINSFGLKGLGDGEIDGLDELDIALVRPEFSGPVFEYTMNSSFNPGSTYKGKGKGRSRD